MHLKQGLGLVAVMVLLTGCGPTTKTALQEAAANSAVRAAAANAAEAAAQTVTREAAEKLGIRILDQAVVDPTIKAALPEAEQAATAAAEKEIAKAAGISSLTAADLLLLKPTTTSLGGLAANSTVPSTVKSSVLRATDRSIQRSQDLFNLVHVTALDAQLAKTSAAATYQETLVPKMNAQLNSAVAALGHPATSDETALLKKLIATSSCAMTKTALTQGVPPDQDTMRVFLIESATDVGKGHIQPKPTAIRLDLSDLAREYQRQRVLNPAVYADLLALTCDIAF